MRASHVALFISAVIISWVHDSPRHPSDGARRDVACEGNCANEQTVGSRELVESLWNVRRAAVACDPADSDWARSIYAGSPSRIRTQPKAPVNGWGGDPVPAVLAGGLRFSGDATDRMLATFALGHPIAPAKQAAIRSRCARGQEIDTFCAMKIAYEGEAQAYLALAIGRSTGYLPSIALDRGGREYTWTLDELKFLHKQISKLPGELASADPVIVRKIPRNSCECEDAPTSAVACRESPVAGCRFPSYNWILLKEHKVDPQVVIHEIAHHVDERFTMKGFDTRFKDRHCMSSLYTAFGDVHEIFAENFGDYVVSAPQLLDTCPAQYEFYRENYFHGQDYLVSWSASVDPAAANRHLRDAAAKCLAEVVSANEDRFRYAVGKGSAGGYHSPGIFLTWFSTTRCHEAAADALALASANRPAFCGAGAEGVKQELKSNLVNFLRVVIAREMKAAGSATVTGIGARLAACALEANRSKNGCASFEGLP